jgi:hypothetical protein
MKKIVAVVFMISLIFSVPVHAQTAKDAIKAMKRLEAYFETGISYRDYVRALGEAKFEVNQFLESKDVESNKKLTEVIVKTISEYDDAKTIFSEKLKGPYRTIDNVDSFLTGEMAENAKKINKYYQIIVEQYPESNKLIADGGAIVDVSEKDGRRINLSNLLPIILNQASKDLAEASALLAQANQGEKQKTKKKKK